MADLADDKLCKVNVKIHIPIYAYILEGILDGNDHGDQGGKLNIERKIVFDPVFTSFLKKKCWLRLEDEMCSYW